MSAPRSRRPATTVFTRGAISATRRAAVTQWCASHMSQMITAALAPSQSLIPTNRSTACIHGCLTTLSREAGGWHALHQLQRVLIVDLLQHRIGEIDPVQLPERVITAIVIEVVVARLEHAPVVRIL